MFKYIEPEILNILRPNFNDFKTHMRILTNMNYCSPTKYAGYDTDCTEEHMSNAIEKAAGGMGDKSKHVWLLLDFFFFFCIFSIAEVLGAVSAWFDILNSDLCHVICVVLIILKHYLM